MDEPRYLSAAPAGVPTYESSHAFLAEDPRRSASPTNPPGDLGGWDVGHRFELAAAGYDDPDAHSEWRISIHHQEVYAVLRRHPDAELHTFDGPVWLIDYVPDVFRRLNVPIVDDFFRTEVEPLQDGPDSLIAATRVIRSAFGLARSLTDSPMTLFTWMGEEIEQQREKPGE